MQNVIIFVIMSLNNSDGDRNMIHNTDRYHTTYHRPASPDAKQTRHSIPIYKFTQKRGVCSGKRPSRRLKY